jgi:uncharacterized membrane protein HdeD (DUF308 family)
MSVQIGGVRLERSRSGWDVVLGLLLIVAGVAILAHAVAATVVSVFFLGWLAVIGGIVGLVAGLVRIGKGGFWPAIITGSLLLVLGVVILRNPAASAVTLTLIAGTLFLMGGVIRLIAAFQIDQNRWIMVVSGLVSLALGLIVVLNLLEASSVRSMTRKATTQPQPNAAGVCASRPVSASSRAAPGYSSNAGSASPPKGVPVAHDHSRLGSLNRVPRDSSRTASPRTTPRVTAQATSCGQVRRPGSGRRAPGSPTS